VELSAILCEALLGERRSQPHSDFMGNSVVAAGTYDCPVVSPRLVQVNNSRPIGHPDDVCPFAHEWKHCRFRACANLVVSLPVFPASITA
jgi:hypothetical protein